MTTIEILAPYLPYDVEVETPSGRMKVFAMDKWSISATYSKGGTTGFEVGYGEILPVLFGFADLCTPLADGTVPAVEVAKMMIRRVCCTQQISRYELHPQTDGVVVYAYEPVPFQDERIYAKAFITDSDGLLVHGKRSESWPVENLFKAIDYLRRNHFAVGLTAEQYIRKQAV